ncbi:response regulator [Paenibacillus albidus]|uniref:helix-turn-helix domain-containing protein n=1 Tax=Paenibacillus albidus TaxID=2041023 RepID=UPI001BE8551B|nr:helix-turn-helix domain-containing protein [Paenibacillus albidus]MBT2292933.1 response regulator [Paenibacillus albidus]
MNNYKVILVEDEYPARTVFRGMIGQRGDLFTLCGEAEDGQEGLELFLKFKPELIVTDITMPGMNGLEMLRQIEHSGLPQPQIIILTCHQDFHYAQQAIQLKAASYLIKDDCLSDPELLTRTLEELSQKVVSLDQSREKQLLLEQKVRSSEIEIEQGLFLDMLRSPAAGSKWLLSLEEAHIPVRSGRFRALLLELDRSSLRFSMDQLEELKLWQFAGVNVLKELLGRQGANKVITLDKGRFFAVYVDDSRQEDSRRIDLLVQSFAANLKMGVLALEYVFHPGTDSPTEAIKHLATASYPFFYLSNQTLKDRHWEKLLRFSSIPEHLSRFWAKVLKAAFLEPGMGSSALPDQERSSLYQQAAEQRWEPEQIKSLYLRVFLELSHFIADTDGGTDLEASFRKKLEICQTFHAVHDTALSYFRKLRQLQGEGTKLNASITKIVQRIHEDLNYPYKLEELAASINYSVPYFSSMFKRTVGESFIQYLTRQRIEKAKLLLLTTDQKTFEIAEAIGFENYRSFNRIFKKETGVTPSDFRRMGAAPEQV